MNSYGYILIFLNIVLNISLLGASGFGFNNERSSFIDSFISTPLEEKWHVQLPGNIISSPVIYKDKVFITTRFGYLIALNLYTGEWLWDYSTSGFNDSTPYVSSNTVILTSMDSKLYAFDIDVDTSITSNAKIKWIFDLKSPSVSSPLVYKNKVYAGSSSPENALYIIDFKTGSLISKKQFTKPISSVIGMCMGRIIFGGNDGRIYSMSEDGGEITYYQTRGGSFNMKAIACDSSKLYSLPGYDERILYVNHATNTALINQSGDLTGNYGTEQWNWQDTSSPAVSTDTVYFIVGIDTVNLVALDKSDLSVRFSSGPFGNISDYKVLSTPLVVGDKVFFTTTNGRFYVLSATGSVLQVFDLNSPSYSSVYIKDGWVIVCEFDGSVRGYKSARYLFFNTPEYDEIITSNTYITINFKDNPDSYILDYSPYLEDKFVLISSGAISAGEYSSYKLSDFNIDSIPNGDYKLRIRLFNSNNMISYATQKIKINKPPSPPSSLVAMDNPNDNCNKIKLSFNPVSNAIGYNIYRSSYGLNNWILLDKTTSTVYIDKTAICGSTFSYRVSAYDEWVESEYSNISSAYSINDNPLNDLIPPADVSDLVVSAALCPGSVLYRFSQVGDDGFVGRARYYEIGYSTSLPFDWNNAVKIRRDVMAMPYDIENGLINNLYYNTTYYFQVRVCDYACNCSNSNTASANTSPDNVMPLPPQNFKAYDTEGDRGGSITLIWEKSESEDFDDCERLIYGYRIYRTTKTFDYTLPYAEVSKSVYGYVDKNAITGIRYYYKVCAYDSTNIACSNPFGAISADNFKYVSIKNGGVLTTDNGSSITIKERTLNQDDYMIFYRIKKEEILNRFSQYSFKNQAQNSFIPTDIIYRFETSNPLTKLNSYATIKIVYLSTEVASIDENNLRIYYYDNGRWIMLRNSKVNPEGNYVVSEYDKFGYYAVFGYIPQGEVFDNDWIYTYPNPAKGDKLTFKFVVNYNSDIKIKIYNVAGEIIKELEMKNAQGGLINEMVWDIRDMASGVYVYIFEASGSGGKKSVKKKLAIIH
ncbi:MAG: PQQ-binding-like beta-propeller repeat protein [Elusimicrobiales bacterium]